MRTRTRYQQGNVCLLRRKSGERVWVYRWRERSSSGKTTRKAQVIGVASEIKTKAAALKAAERLRLAANPATAQARTWTFGAVTKRFVESELLVRNSTRTHYMPWINNHILPKWGALEISKVKPFAVREWLRSLELSNKSKLHIRSLMKQVFAAAMLLELVDLQVNPMSLVKLSNDVQKKQRRILSAKEFQDIAAGVPEQYRLMVLIAGCLGLRVCEILGLQWQDVNWEKLELHIQRDIVLGQQGKPKTPASMAVVPLDAALATILLEHRRKTAPESESAWMFFNPLTGKPWRPHRIQQRYIRPVGEAVTGDPNIGWHTFRHSYSSMLRSLGVDLKVQQELLRHTDVRFTLNTYTQADKSQKREAVEMVARGLMDSSGLSKTGKNN
jgi:integrase